MKRREEKKPFQVAKQISSQASRQPVCPPNVAYHQTPIYCHANSYFTSCVCHTFILVFALKVGGRGRRWRNIYRPSLVGVLCILCMWRQEGCSRENMR